MDINGTLVNYFVFCKRKCYLHYHNIKSEHTSDLVKLGKYYHQEYEADDEEEKIINGVKIDKIQGDYLIEYKKSNADTEAAKWQLIFYLWKLKQVGIIKQGKLKFKDNRDNIEVSLTKENEKKLMQMMEEIEQLLSQEQLPALCKNCRKKNNAYYDFNAI